MARRLYLAVDVLHADLARRHITDALPDVFQALADGPDVDRRAVLIAGTWDRPIIDTDPENAAVHDVETRRTVEAEAPVVRLFPGPEADGRPTWFCAGADVPADHEWRRYNTSNGPDGRAWEVKGSTATSRPTATAWVQVRRQFPLPGDVVYVADPRQGGQDAVSVPVSFAEVCEAVTYAFPGLRGLTDPDPSEPEGSVAVAVWRLLTEGTTGA